MKNSKVHDSGFSQQKLIEQIQGIYQNSCGYLPTLSQQNRKLYLYDMVNIKRKRALRLSNSYTVTNPVSFLVKA